MDSLNTDIAANATVHVAADGLTLYEVTVRVTEPGSRKDRMLGSLICGAKDEEDAMAQAKTDLWSVPEAASGQKPQYDCRALERYFSCPTMTQVDGAEAFVEGKEHLRWTLDRVTGMLVDADALEGAGSSKWIALTADERADLQANIEDADVEGNPDAFGVFAVDSLPDWSASAPKPPASDIVAFLSRRQNSGRGPAA